MERTGLYLLHPANVVWIEIKEPDWQSAIVPCRGGNLPLVFYDGRILSAPTFYSLKVFGLRPFLSPQFLYAILHLFKRAHVFCFDLSAVTLRQPAKIFVTGQVAVQKIGQSQLIQFIVHIGFRIYSTKRTRTTAIPLPFGKSANRRALPLGFGRLRAGKTGCGRKRLCSADNCADRPCRFGRCRIPSKNHPCVSVTQG